MRWRSQPRHGSAGARLLVSLCLLAGAPAWAAEEFACADGVSVQLSSPTPVQGGLILVEVESSLALTDLKAAWVGERLRYWPADGGGNVQRALLGVDMEHKAGLFPLTVSAALKGGQRLACSALVSVVEGEFAVERLQVARRFVELNQKDRKRARGETEHLLGIFGAVTSERLWKGGFQPPLEEIEGSGNFGRRRVLNGKPRSPHSGEDFPAPAGTPVRAAQRGRVVLAEDYFFSGNTVVVDHGLGLYTFYGHLQSMAVKKGDVVEAGALLGQVGATGRVTGAHLHWAARLNRKRVNPLALAAVLSD